MDWVDSSCVASRASSPDVVTIVCNVFKDDLYNPPARIMRAKGHARKP